MDRALADAYHAVLSMDGADRREVADGQLAWLRERDRRCHPTDAAQASADAPFRLCLAAEYRTRIAALAATPVDQAACLAVAATLRSLHDASVPSGQSVADLAAAVPGSPLRLDDRVGRGLTLESSYAGSLNCQSPRLREMRDGVATELDMPAPFGPQEGSHCGSDRVRLVSIHGIPGLLDETSRPGRQGTESELVLSLRVGSRWTDACQLRAVTEASYTVAIASCRTGSCGEFSVLAARYSGAHHGLRGVGRLPTAEDLPPDQRARYADLVRLASDAGIDRADEVPLFGDGAAIGAARADPRCYLTFDGTGREFFPFVAGDRVLLGKIGHDGFGFGAHSGGPNDALAVYEGATSGLRPVAGFCVVAEARRLAVVD
jgi:hypothetical protein